MSTEQGSDDLDGLSTHELRERAFAKAEHAADDGSAGGLGESISGAIEFVGELLGRHDGSMEPMLRARYLDYLRNN